MCVSKISTFHLDKKCVAIHYLLRWPPLPNDPKCVTQYFETRLDWSESEGSDADLFMEHCQKNVPITHVDCSPMEYLLGPIKIVPLLNSYARLGSNFDLKEHGSTHLFCNIIACVCGTMCITCVIIWKKRLCTHRQLGPRTTLNCELSWPHFIGGEI